MLNLDYFLLKNYAAKLSMFESCHITSIEFKESFAKLAKKVLFTALTFSTVSENKNLKVLAVYLFNITVVHFLKKFIAEAFFLSQSP